jgi:hypothetical protein
MDSPT